MTRRYLLVGIMLKLSKTWEMSGNMKSYLANIKDASSRLLNRIFPQSTQEKGYGYQPSQAKYSTDYDHAEAQAKAKVRYELEQAAGITFGTQPDDR